MTESILLKYEKFIIGYEKEGRRIMEILGKVLSEKTEAIYKDITEGLIYPIKIVKLDPENEEDCSRPVAMDTGKKEFIVKVDNTLEDSLFENALIRDIIYCQQMSNNAPVLSAKDCLPDRKNVRLVESSLCKDHIIFCFVTGIYSVYYTRSCCEVFIYDGAIYS